MEEEKTFVTRKDGIAYYRKKGKLDGRLNIKVEKRMIEDLKKIANRNGNKYQSIVKQVLEDFIEQNIREV